MAKGKSRGDSHKTYQKTYDYAKQKLKRLERAARKQPNNLQAQNALERFKKSPVSQMKRSGNKGGWVQHGTWPVNSLGRESVKIPCSEGFPTEGFSEHELFMRLSPAGKRKYVELIRPSRYAHLIPSKGKKSSDRLKDQQSSNRR